MTLFLECYANVVFIGAKSSPEPRAGNLVSVCPSQTRLSVPLPLLALALHTQEKDLGLGVCRLQCCPVTEGREHS